MTAEWGGDEPDAAEVALRAGEDDRSRPGPATVELDESALELWAGRLGPEAAESGLLVGLRGPLGAGKTTLVRAALRALGVAGPVTSPTYLLHRRYRTRSGSLAHHVDLYRISDPAELDDLGWEELMAGGEPVFVEWAERAGARLPPDRWDVRLDFGGTAGLRRVAARGRGGAPSPPDPEEVVES